MQLWVVQCRVHHCALAEQGDAVRCKATLQNLYREVPRVIHVRVVPPNVCRVLHAVHALAAGGMQPLLLLKQRHGNGRQASVVVEVAAQKIVQRVAPAARALLLLVVNHRVAHALRQLKARRQRKGLHSLKLWAEEWRYSRERAA